MRKLLRDETSDERMAFLPESGVVQIEELIQGLLVLYTKDAGDEAVKSLKYNLPTEPKADDKLEKHEDYQKKVDDFPKWREDAIKEFITDRVKQYEEQLLEKSYEDIYEEYIYSLIDQICELEMLTRYREMCVFYATYKDEDLTEKVFTEFEILENLPKDVKEQLINEYNSLEISGEDLKK
jgi:lantibiotic modifying enzyme